jgi:hypothetical protein
VARLAGRVLLLLLLLGPAVLAEPRDPDYDRVLEAFKAKRWSAFDAAAERFLVEKPDYKYTHSVRYMIAESYRLRHRAEEAIAAYEEYMRVHVAGKYRDWCLARIINVLNTDLRHEEAEERARSYLEAFPTGAAAGLVSYELAAALEGMRSFDEAAAAYLAITGRYAERARYRRGVALFRGRRFAESREALTQFLEAWPESRYASTAKDYLFRTDAGFAKIEDGIVADYAGKYVGDPRFEEIRTRLPALRKAALERIGEVLGRPPPESFLIRFADAGSDRSGNAAQTRIELSGGEVHQVLILKTEYLVLDAHDLSRTLVHELYHCLQRELLGEEHFRVPKWVREGSAIFVAGQADERIRLLAAQAGRRRDLADPLGFLVDGLDGRHTSDDYAEDVAAFEWVEEKWGRERLLAFLRKLLETSDVDAAIEETLEVPPLAFREQARAWTLRRLEPLVSDGRAELLRAMELLASGDPGGALKAMPGESKTYAPVVSYYRARALYDAGRTEEALREIREVFLVRHRHFRPLLDNALFLELKALKALGSGAYATHEERARLDLEPTSCYPALLKWLESQD